MAGNFNNLFSAVNQTMQISGTEETVRSIVSSPLATGVRPNIGTSFLPKTQTLRIASGSDASVTGSNQNDRGQIPPATMNKVPRLYGNVTTGGVIVDAHKSDANTIFVAMVLSEHNANVDSGGFDLDREYSEPEPGLPTMPAWEIHDVYYNNFECNINVSGGNGKVTDLIPLDGTANIDIRAANVLNVYAWAGNSDATSMIFPVDGFILGQPSVSAKNAYDVFPTWTANANPMTNLVFAIVEVDRLNEDLDPTANIEIDDIGEWRFTIESRGLVTPDPNTAYTNIEKSLSNPSAAMQEYLRNPIYGVGLTEADLDQQSFDDWYDYCDEQYYYASTEQRSAPDPGPVASGTLDGTLYWIYSIERWKISSFVNTQVAVSENIDEIGKAGQGTLAYDNRTGKFRVLVNRPASNSEITNAFLFNEDNIVSGIQVNSTDLYSLFNFADATFPNNLQQDQPDSAIVQTPTADKLNNEPTSGMSFQLTSVNNRYHAAQMANNSLKASRVGNMCRFDADYSTLDVQVGDYIKVTDKSKGWDEKYWRVMRATELEGEAGEIVMQFSAIEYDEFVFEDIIYIDDRDRGFADGISLRESFFELDELTFNDVYASQFPVIDRSAFGGSSTFDIIVVDDPASGYGDVYYANGVFNQVSTLSNLRTIAQVPASIAADEPYIAVATIIDLSGSNANIQTNWSSTSLTLVGIDDNGDSPAFTETKNTYILPAGTTLDTSSYSYTSLNKVSSGVYRVDVQYDQDDSVPSRHSGVTSTPNISVFLNSILGNSLIDTYGVGTQLVQSVSITDPVGFQGSIHDMHTPIEHDICNVKHGAFEFTTNFTPTWSSITTSDDVAFTPKANILFMNNANISSHTVTIGGGGLDIENIEANVSANLLNTAQSVTTTINTDPAFHGLDADWYPTRMHVVMQGRNTATGGNFTNVNYTITNQDAFYRNA